MGWLSNCANTSSMLLPSERSISPTARSKAKGGTWSCSFASSSAMSAGSRSRRVDSIWPNLTKIGPSVSSASRRRSPRSGSGAGREARQEAVEPEAQPHVQDAEERAADCPCQPLSASRSMRFSRRSRPSRSCASSAADVLELAAPSPAGAFPPSRIRPRLPRCAARRRHARRPRPAPCRPRGARRHRRRSWRAPPPRPSAGGGTGTSLRWPGARCPPPRSRAAGAPRLLPPPRARPGRA